MKKSSPKNLSVNCRPTVGRQLTDSRPTGFLGSSSSQLPGEGHSCDGIYLWKIENLAKCHQDDISGASTVMYSPGFYTSPHGYKLCLRMVWRMEMVHMWLCLFM